MTNKEILQTIQALRCCAKELGNDDACENCKAGENQDRMSDKLYGAYLTSVQNVREAKLELAKQAAQCVERAMLDDDMFLVKGDTVGWKVRIYRNVADNYGDLP